jgi:hypothetical protein
LGASRSMGTTKTASPPGGNKSPIRGGGCKKSAGQTSKRWAFKALM